MLKSALKKFVIFSCQCPRPRKSNQLFKKSTTGKSAFFKHQKSQQNNKKKLSSKEKRLKVLLRRFNYSIRPLNRKRTAMANGEQRMSHDKVAFE